MPPHWMGPTAPPASLADLAATYGRRLGDCIAFPGLINSHDHLAFNCYPPTGSPPYDDFLGWSHDVQANRALVTRIEAIPARLRVQVGLLKNLLWGVTAVADHGGAPVEGPIRVLAPFQDLHSPELASPWRWMAGLGPAVTHLAEGVTVDSRRRALAFLKENLFRRAVAGVHGVSLEGEDFRRLAALVWCPASNLFLFGRTADAAAALRHTQLLFGTDATISAPGTLWDHLRQARGRVADAELFASLTFRAARFWRHTMADDLVIARRTADDPWDAFFALTPADILLVVRAGQPVLVDDRLSAPPGFGRLTVGGEAKHVRMSVAEMLAALRPQLDTAALLSRFGVVAE
ncbi:MULTISPECIES: amidohydrolase family protein [Nitrospirillum]|uniref:Cytosine/adenosine deaminase-related metal-dependent hydrolase n=1 Tax=Nitrospirillum amazonense TaxID=28077 RepID=A0A560F193_9PROT|nr:hypothetical protein [Nitrospirillum amazonense]MEC4589745.1 hypothetical protein [Nitrospirillum amazonense]TWB15389.1 cytosine/adenosine deaminase-related metal-dependent hydrolase [Nitrospirillum amazonense]